ncbi:hypothetical protein [Massilia sp. YIM B02443]|uniref:hypothetical protein n=1 Tax=Massilia sp. YIM B02443 TaxID=3050127 RepID=UPI0025B6E6DB|nr:hypothetical protein [Massilia sp. YIM B02443]MDN4039147.1 hypothetical protein [Massilia sp. YIM B02443]
MTLPDLALQIVYARLGWAVVATTIVCALWRGPALTRPLLVAIMGGALVAMALPGQLSPAWWLGLAFQYPSGLLVGCCALRLFERWHGIRRSRAMPHTLAGVLVVCGTLLYLDTFGLLARGFYYAGFWPVLAPLAAALGAAACALAVVRGHARSPAAAMLGAIALFSLLRLPTGNLWDAMLDPLLCGWAVFTLAAGALRKSGRRATDPAAGAPVAGTPESPLAPVLQPAPVEQFSSVKE